MADNIQVITLKGTELEDSISVTINKKLYSILNNIAPSFGKESAEKMCRIIVKNRNNYDKSAQKFFKTLDIYDLLDGLCLSQHSILFKLADKLIEKKIINAYIKPEDNIDQFDKVSDYFRNLMSYGSCEELYNHLKIKPAIATMLDEDNNTILHHVAGFRQLGSNRLALLFTLLEPYIKLECFNLNNDEKSPLDIAEAGITYDVEMRHWEKERSISHYIFTVLTRLKKNCSK